MPNYDESLKEPSVLPAKVPALLINGSAGIAVGMATNIPPHNLSEVVDGLIMLIDNSDIEIPELMTAIKGLIFLPELRSLEPKASAALILPAVV